MWISQQVWGSFWNTFLTLHKCSVGLDDKYPLTMILVIALFLEVATHSSSSFCPLGLAPSSSLRVSMVTRWVPQTTPSLCPRSSLAAKCWAMFSALESQSCVCFQQLHPLLSGWQNLRLLDKIRGHAAFGTYLEENYALFNWVGILYFYLLILAAQTEPLLMWPCRQWIVNGLYSGVSVLSSRWGNTTHQLVTRVLWASVFSCLCLK